MLNHQQSTSEVRSDLEDRGLQLLSLGFVQPCRWLVEEQERRVEGQRSCDPKAPLVAVGQ